MNVEISKKIGEIAALFKNTKYKEIYTGMMKKYTYKIVLLALLTLGSVTNLLAQNNSGTIRGTVKDEDGKPVGNAVVLLYNEGAEIENKKTDPNGTFSFVNVDPATYIIKVSRTGYKDFGSDEFEVTPNNTINLNFKIETVNFVVGSGKVNQGQQEQRRSLGKTETSTSIKQGTLIKTGQRGFTALAGLSSGVTQTGSGLSGRGSRTDATAIFIDGVRVFNSSLTQGMSSSVEILQAGIPAQYGDFTGLGVSLTTKGGVSSRTSKSLEIVSSSMFNPYHLNLIEGFISTPILFKINPKYTATSKNEPRKIAVAALNFGGNFSYQKDAPSYIGYYQIKDEALAELEKNPLAVNKDGGFVNAASFLGENDFDNVKVRKNARSFSTNMQAKFDFRLSELSTLSFFTNFTYGNSTAPGGTNAAMMTYKTNPLGTSTSLLSYLKFTQRFKDPDSTKRANGTTLNNAYFTVRFDYQSSWTKSQDANFGDNIFEYGFIGKFKHYPTAAYAFNFAANPSSPAKMFVDQNGDTVYLKNFYEQSGFRDTSIKFIASDINRVRANYTQNVFDKTEEQGGRITSDNQILFNQGLLNGYNPNSIYSLFNVPGIQQAGYSKSQSERYTLYALGEAELKGPAKADKKSSSHALQFGLTYEQTVNRGYGLGANNLWRLMYQLANSHISELDKSNPILVYDANGTFQDTVKYNRLVNTDKQSNFDREFRNKLMSEGATDIYGKPITATTFIDVNSYNPGDFKLNMFSADELLNNGSSFVSYYGYDHLGNKLRGRPSVNDFLQDKNKRSIGAFMPIYTAAWFQDKFYLDELEFRLGLRLERYDANQLVLKDPYSLYPIRTAGEVTSIDGNPIAHPSNIGSDYAVYVNDVKNPTKILGYRSENTWYDATGKQLSTPDLIANQTSNGKIAPYLVNPNQTEITENSFKDYKPKVNVLPRVFFKFPLNDKSLFYASYDVLAQRPNAGANFLTIDDYYYMLQKNSGTLANPALTSRITTDYQIGFKQQVSKSTLLSLISYYRETKNDISVYQYNQAYPITYISYNNIDFSTVKGFILELDYKSKKNISLNGNYTLQIADGTGSNINSQRALIASNQPNLRSLFPLGDLDIRHQLKGIFNWEFLDDNKAKKTVYYGPIIGKTKILKNTNFNVTYSATSGLPYTATSSPVQLGSADRATIKGTPYGSRLPWQFNTNLNISKDILLNWKDKNTGVSKGAYLQVYYLVTNLLNTKNVYGVYQYTGTASDDGFLNSAKGQQYIKTTLSSEAYNYYYRTAVNSPGNYQAPRFMRIGAKLYF